MALLAFVILAVTALRVNAASARGLDAGPSVATLNTEQISFIGIIDPRAAARTRSTPPR